jgi:hypothetical protein
MLRASWQLSAWVALGLFAGYLVCRLSGWPRLAALQAFCLHFGVFAAVFAVYQHTEHYAHSLTDGAQERAVWIWTLEQRLHLPSERVIQQWVLPFPPLVRALNAYYAGLHLTSMTAFLVWMWWRHKAYYTLAWVTVAATTLVCVTLQHVAVAPPRLVPDLGFVDTGLTYGQSMYGPAGSGIAGQLAAMPSIHVVWAGIIAAFGVALSTSRWRWLLAVHFVLTFLVVVATANHWWLDGVVGLTLAAVVVAVARRIFPPRPASGDPRSSGPPHPSPRIEPPQNSARSDCDEAEDGFLPAVHLQQGVEAAVQERPDHAGSQACGLRSEVDVLGDVTALPADVAIVALAVLPSGPLEDTGQHEHDRRLAEELLAEPGD